jgi:chemotaxis protein methyltransferase CheR
MAVVCEPRLGDREFKGFQKLIYELAGISLADTKQVMVQGRLARRLRLLNLESYGQYLELLLSRKDADEITNFINALTTNKTAFFREKHHFDFLMNKVFPEIRERSKNGGPRRLRIWCSASSTGEEPYTIAMCAREFFGNNGDWDIRVLASDIDTNVLETASQGIYRDDLVEDIPKDLLHRYFLRSKDGVETQWQAKPVLRDLITFRRLNLTHGNWPINTTFDVIFCRNVMIYFDVPTQKVLIERFAEKLQSHGYLIVGHSESLFGVTDAFKPIGETVYRMIDGRHGKSPAIECRAADTSPMNPPVSPATEPLRKKENPPVHRAAPASSIPVKISTAPSVHSVIGNEKRFPIIVGEVHASDEPVWVSTLLGSCVAACLYDDVAHIGGMNHFMLPNSLHNSTDGASLGIHAMELLINEIMKRGGDRRRLKAKLFGGGAVVRSSDSRWNVGDQNIEFAQNFLKAERIPLISSHTGGDRGMHVYFHTQSAKALVRLLDQQASLAVQSDQQRLSTAVVTAQIQHQDITLF